jgi:pimeloyl-ACP methyl ester carboxylesterase
MEFKRINYDGAEIHVTTKGNIADKAIVFLHGNSLDSNSFKEQFDSLNIPLVAIDLPGHGKSAPATTPEKTYSIAGYVDAVVNTIQELGLKNYVLAGHSLGGHIAIEVLPYLDVKGLLIFGTPPLDSIAALAAGFLSNPLFPFLLQEKLSPDEAAKLAAGMLVQPGFNEQLKDSITNTHAVARSFLGASIANGLMEDEIEILQSHNIPLAILHGNNDSFVSIDYLNNLNFSSLWQNKVHVLSECGHCPQLEQADEFNKLVNAFYNAAVN